MSFSLFALNEKSKEFSSTKNFLKGINYSELRIIFLPVSTLTAVFLFFSVFPSVTVKSNNFKKTIF